MAFIFKVLILEDQVSHYYPWALHTLRGSFRSYNQLRLRKLEKASRPTLSFFR